MKDWEKCGWAVPTYRKDNNDRILTPEKTFGEGVLMRNQDINDLLAGKVKETSLLKPEKGEWVETGKMFLSETKDIIFHLDNKKYMLRSKDLKHQKILIWKHVATSEQLTLFDT